MAARKVKDVSKKKRKRRLIIPLYILVLVILIVLIYVFPSVTGALSETMTIEYGTLHNSYDVTCYIIRDETVYYAAGDGSVAYHFEEGAGVRTGTQVVTLDTSGSAAAAEDYSSYNERAGSVSDLSAVLSDQGRLESVKSDITQQISELSEDEKNSSSAERLNKYLSALGNLSDVESAELLLEENASVAAPDTSFGVDGSDTAASAGILSYVLDGYEAALNPCVIGLLDEEKLKELDYDSTYNANTGKTLKGEPLFKVVNQKKWYAVTWIDENELASFSEGTDVELALPKASVEGTISKLYDNGDRIMVVIAFDNYYEDLASIRRVETKLSLSNEDGLIVDNDFIVTKEGQPGVYVVDVTGEATFTPVNILGSDGSSTLVSSGYYYEQTDDGSVQVETVNAYDEIKKVSQKEAQEETESSSDG